MELKYTSDGKKVAVIGKLNAQETIVQEIFVINEQEIPSGENFVTKSLHDSPAISWKEKEEGRIEANLNKIKDQYKRAEDDYERLVKTLRNKTAAVKDHIKYIESMLKSDVDPSILNTLSDFLSGDMKYIVWENYELKIQPFLDAIQQPETGYYSDNRYEALRLLSLFGNDDGTFSWKLNQYRDGSGSYWYDISAFKTLEEAKERLKELIIQKGVTDQTIKKADQYGIELPKELLQEWRNTVEQRLQNQIDEHLKQIDKLTQQKEEYLPLPNDSK